MTFFHDLKKCLLQRYEKKPVIVEDEADLGIPESDLLRRGEKVRILHHQPREFTTEADSQNRILRFVFAAFFIQS